MTTLHTSTETETTADAEVSAGGPRVDALGRRMHRVFQPSPDRKPRTYFVNGEVLGQVLVAPEDAPVNEAPRPVSVRRIDDAVTEVRANVQDAARAVLTWLAAVVQHDDEDAEGLDDVVLRCLRPSADPKDVNYTALAQDIRRVTGTRLTAKRVQTAVRHLRKASAKNAEVLAKTSGISQKQTEEKSQDAGGVSLGVAMLRLRQRLADHFVSLNQAHQARNESTQHTPITANECRELGIDLLASVRAAAARVIDRGFGEHIPGHTDLSALEGRFLGYLRDTLSGQSNEERNETRSLHADFRRLLLTMSDHPLANERLAASPEHDVKLVLHGSRIVAALLGPDSLPGVLAHLNVLVVGRDLLDTDLYVAEMLRLADAAQSLHEDAETQKLLRWCRRQPKEAQRNLPGAVRVASYARSNAATRLYERAFLGMIDAHADAPALPTMRDAGAPLSYLDLADRTLEAMEATDTGFTLALTTRLLAHTTHARLTGKRDAALDYFRGLGEAKTLDRLEALIKFDNGDEIVSATRRLAETAYPGLRHRLLVTR